MFSMLLCVSKSSLSLATIFVMMQPEKQSGFCVLTQVDEDFLLSVVKFSFVCCIGQKFREKMEYI